MSESSWLSLAPAPLSPSRTSAVLLRALWPATERTTVYPQAAVPGMLDPGENVLLRAAIVLSQAGA